MALAINTVVRGTHCGVLKASSRYLRKTRVRCRVESLMDFKATQRGRKSPVEIRFEILEFHFNTGSILEHLCGDARRSFHTMIPEVSKLLEGQGLREGVRRRSSLVDRGKECLPETQGDASLTSVV